jgi:hypothetical protein
MYRCRSTIEGIVKDESRGRQIMNLETFSLIDLDQSLTEHNKTTTTINLKFSNQG